jgi:hypothetical protein
LLAIGQRTLPVLKGHLEDLMGFQTKLIPRLKQLVPDWEVLSEYVPANESSITRDLFLKLFESDDQRELLSLKKAIDRDIGLLKIKISDEEDKISDYKVVPTSIG